MLFDSEYISICECCGCAMTFDEEMKLTFLPKDLTETLLSVPELAEGVKALYERWRRTKGHYGGLWIFRRLLGREVDRR